MSKETDLAWVAGFIDGEACITIRKYKGQKAVNFTHQLDIHLSNTSREALEKVQSVLGVGVIHSIPQRAKLGFKETWQFVIVANQAEAALRQVLPYLIAKRREADIALEFAKLPRESYGRDGVPEHIMQMREDLFLRIRAGRSKGTR